jgi:hypothetical protein
MNHNQCSFNGAFMVESMHSQWLVDGWVRLLTLTGDVDSETFQAYDRDTSAMMDTMTRPLFHVIVDVRKLESFPPLNVCLGMTSIRHPRMGWMISVGATKNALMRFFLTVVVTAARIRYKDFEHIDEAVAFLRAHDAALPMFEVLPSREVEVS